MEIYEMEVEIDYVGKETLRLKVEYSDTIASLIGKAAKQMGLPKHNSTENPITIGAIRLDRRLEVSG